jgi:hypothetical protein
LVNIAMKTVICKRCLLAELDDLSTYESVIKYRKTIPAAEQTNEHDYQVRLNICRQCRHLTNGMCDQCGCYVEMRAASYMLHCPFKHW